jgi:hypothetical protein
MENAVFDQTVIIVKSDGGYLFKAAGSTLNLTGGWRLVSR